MTASFRIQSKESVWVLGQKVTFLHLGKEAAVLEVWVPPGLSKIPPHSHLDTDQLFYLLDGEIEIQIEEEWYPLSPGQSITAARTTIHSYRNKSSEAARMVVISSPGGLEEFIRDVGFNSEIEGGEALSHSNTAFQILLASGPSYRTNFSEFSANPAEL